MNFNLVLIIIWLLVGLIQVISIVRIKKSVCWLEYWLIYVVLIINLIDNYLKSLI